jgi:hypothetical protein
VSVIKIQLLDQAQRFNVPTLIFRSVLCHELDSIQHSEFTCETSCPTNAEGVESMVPRKIFGPEEDEDTG